MSFQSQSCLLHFVAGLLGVAREPEIGIPGDSRSCLCQVAHGCAVELDALPVFLQEPLLFNATF
jgi:hypothetical protein